MKRLGTILVAIFVLIYGIAFCEESVFEFRDGIHFGDNHETVEDKETLHGMYNPNGCYLEYNGVLLSGIERSNLVYMFSSDDRLNVISIAYGHENLQGEELYNSEEKRYDLIEDGLTTKYGEPVPKESIKDLQCYNYGALYRFQAREDEVLEGEQRIVDYDEANIIIIEHALVRVDTGGKTKFQHLLTYQLIERGKKTEGSVLNDL